jgi:hypothetical protein
MNKIKRLYLTLVFLLIFHSVAWSNSIYAKRIVSIAQSEIGRGETIGDNRGADVLRYTQEKSCAWCAGFVSYVLSRAKANEKLGYNLSARSIYNKAKKLNWIVSKPQAGDLIVFWRGSRNGNLGHVGIVEYVDAQYIYTIEGNTGEFPSKVKRLKYKRHNIQRLLGFVRIEA